MVLEVEKPQHIQWLVVLDAAVLFLIPEPGNFAAYPPLILSLPVS